MPVCNSCETDMKKSGKTTKWRCTNVACQEFDLDQSINDAVQPKSKCGVPQYKHNGNCKVCYPTESLPTCNSCGSVRALKEDEDGKYTICEHPWCNSTDMRFYASYADAPIPKQAEKGETGADTIKARESVYGPFAVHAKAEQDIKRAAMSQPGWEKLNDVQKSAAEMIIHKLARVLNASADYTDNWHDISGYASLAEQEIIKRLGK